KMCHRFLRQAFDLIVGHDEQIGVVGQLKWIKPLIVASQTSKLTKSARLQFKASPFQCWWNVFDRRHSRSLKINNGVTDESALRNLNSAIDYTSLYSESTSSLERATR